MTNNNYKDAVIDFLSKRENLEIALEIDDLMTEIKNIIYLKFWKITKDIITSEVERDESWLVKMEDDIHVFNKNQSGIRIIKLPWQNKDDVPLSLNLLLENKHLYIAYYFKDNPSKYHEMEEINKLRQILQDKKWHKAEDPNATSIWQWLDVNLDDRSTMLNIADDDDTVQQNVASQFLAIFHETRPMLKRINDSFTDIG